MTLSRRTAIRQMSMAAGVAALWPAGYALASQHRPPRVDDPAAAAEAIRRGAGVPDDVITGCLPGTTVGLQNPDVLVPSGHMVLSSLDAIQQEATSGTGTADDPYVIADRDVQNVAGYTGDGGVMISYYATPIHLVIRNCRVSGFKLAQIYQGMHPDSTLRVEQCITYAGADYHGAAGVLSRQGSLTVDSCQIGGTSGNGIVVERYMSYLISNTVFGSFGFSPPSQMRSAIASGHYWKDSETTGGTVHIRYCEIVSGEVQTFLYAQWPRSYLVEYCRIEGATSTAIRGEAGSKPLTMGFTVRFCQIANCNGSGLAIYNCHGGEVAYSTFENCKGRLCVFYSRMYDSGDFDMDPASMTENVEIHHCSGRQTLGEGSFGGYECFELYGFAKDSSIHDCYVSQCTDDAYEVTNARTNVHVYNNVGEKVGHDVVDYWNDGTHRDFNVANQAHNSVHHIYGTMKNVGVLVGGQLRLYISHIYLTRDEEAGGTVTAVLLQTTSMGPGFPDYCRITSPLPPESPLLTPVVVNAEAGEHNVIDLTTVSVGAESRPATASVTLHPNPVRTQCTVRVTLPFAGTAELEILDAQGRRLQHLHAGPIGQSVSFRLDVSGFAPGLYFVRLQWDEGQVVEKVTVVN